MAEAKATNMKVSGTGGAGTNGQPATYMANDYERTGDAGNMELQTSAMLNKSGTNPTPASIGSLRSALSQNQDIIPLDAPTNRKDESVSAGAAMGDGPGAGALSSSLMLNAQNDQDIARLAAHLPVYRQIAEGPNSSAAFKNMVRWLDSQTVTPTGQQ
jgi:hypothetical protein